MKLVTQPPIYLVHDFLRPTDPELSLVFDTCRFLPHCLGLLQTPRKSWYFLGHREWRAFSARRGRRDGHSIEPRPLRNHACSKQCSVLVSLTSAVRQAKNFGISLPTFHPNRHPELAPIA